MSLIVDASVALKLCIPEQDSLSAERMLAGAAYVIAPDLLLAEVANGLWKATRRGVLSSIEAEAGLDRIIRSFPVLHSGTLLAPYALRIGAILDHSVYDCIYVALAECEQIPLVTADRRLLAKVAGTSWAARVQPLSAY